MPRRRAVLAGAAGAAGLAAMPARAQFRVEISGVGGTQLPIAVARFRDEERAGANGPAAIVRADLERSGAFRLVEPGAAALDESSRPAMAEWRQRAADALVAGSVARLADGRFDVRFRLWDVVKGADLASGSHAVEAGDLRLAAHRIADQIHEKLTGEKGVFSTRIAYVSKAGPRYTLKVADADGEGAQDALASLQPIISPAWSPNGRELAYVSFERQKAVVFVHDVASGQRRALADFRGSNSAPAFSPDGQTLVVTLSRDGGSQLYLIGRAGGEPRRLATSPAIDTEAAFSADGRSIYFTSDRGGSPQIYRMPAAGGGNAERVTFAGAYNISPDISPDGRTLAYVARNGGAFRVTTLDLGAGGSGGAPLALTDTSDDEHPSFAPNGRLLVYATRAGGRGVLMTTTLDGKIKARLASSTADVREPTWGPFGR